jgi:hypothetical protein
MPYSIRDIENAEIDDHEEPENYNNTEISSKCVAKFYTCHLLQLLL